MPLVSLVAELPAVLAYVNQTARNAHPSFTRAEGPVHAQIASASGRDYWIANREVNVAFHNEATNPANSKQDICKPIEGNIWKTVSELGAEDQVKLLARKPLGTGLDFLGVDSAGRILALEAKPSTASVGIQRGPIQTRFYAELIARWLEDDHAALDRVRAMLRQRTQLGLAPAHGGSLQRRVVPVLAIGPGEVPASTKARSRRVAEALNGLTISELVDPLTIWRLDEHGRLDGDPWL